MIRSWNISNNLKELSKLDIIKPMHKSICLGAHHALVLRPDQVTGNPVLYARGSNDFGQCGFSESLSAGIFDEEDDEVLLDWTIMMHGLEDRRILAVDCGDFHSVALMEGGQIRSWGSGILGNGNEWYDSRPQNLRFFEATGRSVNSISARSGMTGCLASSKTGFTETYIWGYMRDNNGELVKAQSPVLLKNALPFDHISSITCGFNGSFGLIGIKDGKSILQLYGATSERYCGIPFAPLCSQVTLIDQVYHHECNIEIPLDEDFKSISIGYDSALLISRVKSQLLDFKTMKLHDLENVIKKGVIGPNSIVFASQDSIYVHGMKSLKEKSGKSISFYEFLKNSLRTNNHSQEFKSTLELLDETPMHIQTSNPPDLLLASHNNFISVESPEKS